MRAERRLWREAPAPLALPNSAWILRRTGLRPLHFTGRLLHAADDSAEPAWSRIRMAVYGCDNGGLVGEIVCCSGATPSGRPWCQAAKLPSLTALVAFFEAMQPAAEIGELPALPCDAAALLLHSVARLRQEADQLRAARHAAGCFLHQLCESAAIREFADHS